MTETEWDACADPEPMIGFLGTRLRLGSIETVSPVGRKLRLFSVGCCRHVEHALTDPRSLHALNVFERYVDRAATEVERQEILDSAAEVNETARRSDGHHIAAQAVYEAIFDVVSDEFKNARVVAMDIARAAKVVAYELQDDVSAGSNAQQAEREYQAELVREMFGNPFRPVTFDPAWHTSDVMLLANGIYAERAFDRMPILADALQDAGCDSADNPLPPRGGNLLDHLRDPNATHVRGCWALDLVLGKE
jgi:hypothetical protein